VRDAFGNGGPDRACGAFVAVLRNHAEIVIADADRECHRSAVLRFLGRAITQWEYLEAKLAELFSQLVGGEWPSDGAPYHPAVRAYGSVLGSAARLTMIEEAAKAHFQWYPNPALERRLKDLIGTECRNFASKRNNIAHVRRHPLLARRHGDLHDQDCRRGEHMPDLPFVIVDARAATSISPGSGSFGTNHGIATGVTPLPWPIEAASMLVMKRLTACAC
jgi:hypothetical protein